jgi:uncharacterized protein YoxC
MRHARRVRRYSVALDASTRRKIRHYLEQIKEIGDRLDASERKKERLYDKINALVEEVDKDRTRFDAAMDLVLEVSSAQEQTKDSSAPGAARPTSSVRAIPTWPKG